MNALPPLIAAYKGEAGPDVLMFGKVWSQASGRPLRVVTIYPGPAPISMGRVDAEWVAYNHEEANALLDEARGLLKECDAEFVAVPSDSAARGLHDVQEQAGPDSILILGSRKTRGVRRTAPGNTAERLLHGAAGPVGLVPWDYEAAPDVPVRRVAVAYINTEDGRAALLTAASMALELHAELQLVTVTPDTRVMPSLGEPSIYRDEERDSYAVGAGRSEPHLARRTRPEHATARRTGGRCLGRSSTGRRRCPGLRLTRLRPSAARTPRRCLLTAAPPRATAGDRRSAKLRSAPASQLWACRYVRHVSTVFEQLGDEQFHFVDDLSTERRASVDTGFG